MYEQSEADRYQAQRSMEFALNRNLRSQEFAHNLSLLNRSKKHYSIMA